MAVLISAPGSSGRTTIVTVTLPPLASVPEVQRTTLPPVHMPWLDRTETKRRRQATSIDTRTFVAVSGPAFRTVSV